MLDQIDWDIRRFVYRAFASRGYPPAGEEIARHFNLSVPEAKRALQRLHQAHTIFLRPGTDDILMANPMSAVATDYQVSIGKQQLYANCAWDALGIPAMLRADARIQARHPLDRETVHFAVEDSKLIAENTGTVHFAIPFRNWYDNLVDT